MRGITVEKFYGLTKDKLKLRLAAGSRGLKRRIMVAELNRPGLALAGYFDYFASMRVQVVGKVEITYLNSLPASQRRRMIRKLFKYKIPCIIVTRNYRPPVELLEEAEREGIPLFRSSMITMTLINKATILLEDEFAPSTTMVGDFLEVFGIGLLIRGESGAGKSECALGLIKRGHRLIADDVVRIDLHEGGHLIGHSPDIVKHHMEIRGLGIINVQALFGATCVKDEQEVEMVVSLEEWDSSKEYDRLGLEDKTIDILGQKLPQLIIPVRPGRDLVLLIEAAALNQRLKKMGKHPVKILDEELIQAMKK